MKILLLGKNGQVGHALAQPLSGLGEVVAFDRRGMNGLSGDLADLEGIRKTVRTLRPNIIVNAAAYTAVDSAESNKELAWKINALAPKLLAEEAKSLGALLVHYSTDYVFSGAGDTPWSEDQAPSPINFYGTTKLEGEIGIQASRCMHLIFRTSWVYASRGNNFISTMIRLMFEREHLNIVSDQIGSPTSAALIADISANAISQLRQDPRKAGLYHLAANGETSWYEYAQLIAVHLRSEGLPVRVSSSDIKPVTSSAYPTAAPRPQNSRLNTEKLKHTFKLSLPEWQQGVTNCLAVHSEQLKLQALG